MDEGHLSRHFLLSEFDLLYVVDTRILLNYKVLCDNLLEPIRAHFNEGLAENEQKALRITSGYRNPLKNKAAGGKPTSYHMADGGRAAADFIIDGTGLFIVFEWLRLESKLPFDKIILEYKNGVPATIHIQVDVTKTPRRKAYIGLTGDSETYDEVPVL